MTILQILVSIPYFSSLSLGQLACSYIISTKTIGLSVNIIETISPTECCSHDSHLYLCMPHALQNNNNKMYNVKTVYLNYYHSGKCVKCKVHLPGSRDCSRTCDLDR